MKKLMMVAIAGLLVFAFAGTVLAFDEEEKDISKRHEAWLGKVMVGQVGREQAKLEGKTQDLENSYVYTQVSDERDDLRPTPTFDNPIKYLAYALDASMNKIKVLNVEYYDTQCNESMEVWTLLYKGIEYDVQKDGRFGPENLEINGSWWNYNYSIVSSDIPEYDPKIKPPKDPFAATPQEVKEARKILGVKVKYGIKVYPDPNDPCETQYVITYFYDKKGKLIGKNAVNLAFRDYSQWYLAVYDENGNMTWEPIRRGGEEEEILQRKNVESQIPLKGNGENYTFSGQMADQPEGAVPLQKKQ